MKGDTTAAMWSHVLESYSRLSSSWMLVKVSDCLVSSRCLWFRMCWTKNTGVPIVRIQRPYRLFVNLLLLIEFHCGQVVSLSFSQPYIFMFLENKFRNNLAKAVGFKDLWFIISFLAAISRFLILCLLR